MDTTDTEGIARFHNLMAALIPAFTPDTVALMDEVVSAEMLEGVDPEAVSEALDSLCHSAVVASRKSFKQRTPIVGTVEELVKNDPLACTLSRQSLWCRRASRNYNRILHNRGSMSEKKLKATFRVLNHHPLVDDL